MYQSEQDPVPGAASPTEAPTAVTAAAEASTEVAPMTMQARGFITELAHAMQAAAEHQREATNGEVEAMTNAHLERVRARAAAEAEELRRMAQQDIESITAWQEAEAERIRDEAARRIVARGEELDGYLVRHAALVDNEVDQIEGVVANYQLQLDDYFDRLTTESDPGVIAKLADAMPEPPDLAKVGGEARAQALAAVVAEADATHFSPNAPGPELVPVMAADATAPVAASGTATSAASDGNGSNGHGSNGSNGTAENVNPAIRLLRSIATLAAPPPDTKAADAMVADANGNGTASASDDVLAAPAPETADSTKA